MTIVTIPAGEVLVVKFEGTDGEFQIHHNTEEYPSAVVIKETDGLPANVVHDPDENIIYHYGPDPLAGDAEEEQEAAFFAGLPPGRALNGCPPEDELGMDDDDLSHGTDEFGMGNDDLGIGDDDDQADDDNHPSDSRRREE